MTDRMTDRATDGPAPEFHRPLAVERLREAGGAADRFEADARERAALARRYAVPGVTAFAVSAAAAPWGPGGWRVEGRARATLTQTCVVTLEPVETEIDEPFARWFAPEARMEEAAALLDPEARDDLEPLGAEIDLGEIAAEIAALAIDPYPRKLGAAFEGRLHGPPDAAPLTDEAARPFAKLAALKRGGDGA